jgi:molecular chaperone GrpE
MKQKEEIVSENNESPENVSETTENVSESQTANAQADSSEKLQIELAEQKEKFIRLYSEFENFRRRTAKEKLDLIQSANEQLIKTLLPVIDDFARAEKSFKDKNDKELEGFFLIHNKFRKVLEQAGVKTMEIKAGADFDADVHEAITQVPVADEKLKGKVVDVIESGYFLNDKVIRFAKVVVGS